ARASRVARTGDGVEVLGRETSGEVEYALLVDAGHILVTVASDHTDRGFERYDIQASKQLYPDVLASEAWPFDECRAHWDRLVLRSWTTAPGGRRVYQEAALARVLSAGMGLAMVGRPRGPPHGPVLPSGTPARPRGA